MATWDAYDCADTCYGVGCDNIIQYGMEFCSIECRHSRMTAEEIAADKAERARQKRAREEAQAREAKIKSAKRYYKHEWQNLTFSVTPDSIRAAIIDQKSLEIVKSLAYEGVEIQIEASLSIQETGLQEELERHNVTADVEFSRYHADDDNTKVTIYIFVYTSRRAIFDFAFDPNKFLTLINEGFGDKWGYRLHDRSKWGGDADKSTNYCNLRIEFH